MSLSDALRVPTFYESFTAAKQRNEQSGARELAQASVLQQLYTQMQQAKQGQVEQQRNEALRAAIDALPPDQRTRENVLPLLLKYSSNAKEMAGMLPAAADKGQAIGSGGLRLPDGTIVPPAARPAPETTEVKPPPVRQRYNGTEVVQEEFVDGTWRQIGKGPRFNPKEPASAQPKPPAGYRYTEDGSLEAIPGGPADLKAQGAFNQDTATLNSVTSSMDRLAVAANEVKNHPGLSRITGLSGSFPDVPGSAAANARAKLQTLKAQVGFAVLQDMRNASKTGGALGQITERELAFLQNALAALDTAQSEEEIKSSLDKILTFVDDSKGRLREAFNMKHRDKGATTVPDAPKYREGQTATGQGGKKIIFKGGVWRPVTSQ